ncbi:MAG TPA: rhodanese-like domain-containing protein [Paracoccus sp. (in: a-proteobacteria)]|nr:rhodanese-like domain-containing protein [Paracoccus sp. (in: a-proteobacteria)]
MSRDLHDIPLRGAALAIALCLAVPALAQDAPRVGITANMAEAVFTTGEGEFTITRDQTPGARLEGDWALIGRDCPPFCIQPMTPAPGVTTIGELELIEAMKAGDTILVDGRTPDWFTGGTIPGAINIPYTQTIERLGELNCEPDFDGKFDCADASRVIMFCNGPWCGQSPTAIREMIGAGFPADRISYYRGGMQEWRLLGLSVRGGQQPAATDPVAAQDVTPAEAAAPGAGQASAASDGLPQNAGQAVPDGITTPAENPIVEGTTEQAAQSSEAPAEGEATAARPGEGELPADPAVTDNRDNAGMTAPRPRPAD